MIICGAYDGGVVNLGADYADFTDELFVWSMEPDRKSVV